jgi:cytochrome P450
MLEEDGTPFDLVKEVTAVAYLAGSDTTVAAVLSFFLAMLVYPDVQAKAQAELDRVVGTDRLPELEDRQALPYVEGVINECLRWLPVLPMGAFIFITLLYVLMWHTGVPHKTTQDDEYNGYFIPKGALVMGSVWSACLKHFIISHLTVT